MKYFVYFVLLLPPAIFADQPNFPPWIDAKIIDGEDARIGQFSYLVSLQYSEDGKYYIHVCGAAILSRTWILTAAHCTSNGYYQAVAGLVALDQEIGVQRRDVSETIVHPHYKIKSKGVRPNDLALMRLDEPFDFNENIGPINLPEKKIEFTGDATFAGWGSISNTSNPTYINILQTETMFLIKDEECIKAWDKIIIGLSVHLNESNICAISTNEGGGACSGDSGGPLAKGNVLIGTASWGIVPCGGEPTVFVEVSHFIHFIRKHVTDL